jgi:tRNA G18 (ribose-2'-O)-methylase SpoU
VTAALDEYSPLVEVFHTPGAATLRASLLGRLKTSTARVSECSDRVMAFLTGTDHPPDVLAVAPTRSSPLEKATGDFVVVLSEIRDPGVVGGIMAAATGAGATSVIATNGTADVFSPAAIRAAFGAHFVVPVSSGHDASEVAAVLSGRRLVALVASPDALDVADAGLKPPLALIVSGGELDPAFATAERVGAGGSSGGVGPGIGARAAIALEEVRRGASA